MNPQVFQPAETAPARCSAERQLQGAIHAPWRIAARYAVAVAAVAMASGLRWLLQDYFGSGVAFITYFPTVALVALVAGGGPGVLATLLSVAVVETWIGLGAAGMGEPLGVALFAAAGLVISATAELFHRARRREVAILSEHISEQGGQIRLLAEALSHLAEGVVITDDQWEWPGPRIVYVNQAMCRITGYGMEELLGQSPGVVHPQAWNQAALARLQSELRAGRPVSCEIVPKRKDGTAYDAETFISPLVDPQGHRTHYVSIYRDISARKQAQQALHESEQRLRAILQAASDAIVTFDQQGTIRSVNSAAEEIFGYRAAEMVGQNLRLLVPIAVDELPDGGGQHDGPGEMRHALGHHRELAGRRRDGSRFPCEAAINEIPRLGLFTGILRDVSERMALQKHVLEIAAEEQRRIGQELHDGTGQELTGLSLYASALLDLLRGSTDNAPAGKTPRTLEEAELAGLLRTAERLAQGLRQANRHVHQLSHGIMPVQIDAEGLRSALAELAAATDGQENIVCRFHCPGPIAVPDNTTATHLYRIAQEAMNNALRHSRADQIEISLQQNGGQLVLAVSDNGIGLDPPEGRRAGGGGMGLRTMEYRAAMIGGALQVGRGGARGTAVVCTLRNGEPPA